jgi:Xaa-Pro aminopeptidase
MTFMAFTGAEPPAEVERVWQAVRGARDAALALVLERARAGRPVMGCEVDRASRAVIEAAGFGERFVHRTGHSLGPETHWVGANMDDYETQDTRRLTFDTGFTIEPGIYLQGAFGVRSEIDVFWDDRGPRVTTEVQDRLVLVTAAGVR